MMMMLCQSKLATGERKKHFTVELNGNTMICVSNYNIMYRVPSSTPPRLCYYSATFSGAMPTTTTARLCVDSKHPH